MFQNTETHSIFIYAFLKTSKTSPVICFFNSALLLPNKKQCVNIKPTVLHIVFAWISLFLTYFSFRKRPVFKERKRFLYVSTELF